jgi:hypothetical protein
MATISTFNQLPSSAFLFCQDYEADASDSSSPSYTKEFWDYMHGLVPLHQSVKMWWNVKTWQIDISWSPAPSSVLSLSTTVSVTNPDYVSPIGTKIDFQKQLVCVESVDFKPPVGEIEFSGSNIFFSSYVSFSVETDGETPNFFTKDYTWDTEEKIFIEEEFGVAGTFTVNAFDNTYLIPIYAGVADVESGATISATATALEYWPTEF